MALVAFVVAAAAACIAPLLRGGAGAAAAVAADFPGWPATYEGLALQSVPMTAREDAFVRGFPGRVGRFHDGKREVIVRWVAAPTRLLHPSADCFRGIGYEVTPSPGRRDSDGGLMSCFRASKGAEVLRVCEIIRDGAASGQTWPDVSAWYWSALFGSSDGPWWSYVVAERE